MVPLSILDLAPITMGSDAGQSLKNTLDLAQHAEAWGYRRYWLAEHHNFSGVASAATAVVLAHVGAGTSTVRIGAGGIMLPNHAPLVIAEQFGTLASLYPGRVDLGLGRAPGTDQATARALRRTLVGDVDRFPNDVVELLGYFQPTEPGQAVQAVPGAGLDVPVWILGSSLFGASLAAHLGLPYAFASHFAPADLDEAIALYRARFRPSLHLDAPHVMAALNVFAADTREEAELVSTSMLQAFANIRRGTNGPLQAPRAGFKASLSAPERAMLDEMLSCTVVGPPDVVHQGIDAFAARTGADEIIVASMIFDHAARLRSYEIAARR
jgi:luciferase family oxidoreductase group 1